MTGIDAETQAIVGGVADDERSPVPQDRPTLAEVLSIALAIGMVAALFPARDEWPAQFLLVILTTTAPGTLLLRLLRRSGTEVAVLAVPASLLVLLTSGLAVDLVGPLLGQRRPLDGGPLLVGFEIVCFGLLAAHSLRLREGTTFGAADVSVPPLRSAVLLVLPLVAAAGAIYLNTNRGAALAVASLIAGAVILVLVFLRAERLSTMDIGVGLFSVALASLWSYSLRSESVFGWDLTSEFLKMNETLGRGSWTLLHRNDAYGAMLSVTVLPVQMHQLTGLSLPIIVKLLFPAIFAVTPVVVYYFGRQFLRRKWAVLAAAILIEQGNFGLQMPQLARQEIGLLLFAALLVVMSRRHGPRSSRLVLTVLFALGIVVSHYSTAYFSIILLLVCVVLLAILIKVRGTGSALAVVATPLVALVVGAFVWNVALTQSTSNVSDVFESLGTSGLQVLPGGQGSLVSRYLTGTVTPTVPAAEYQATVANYYAQKRPYVVPLSDASLPQYVLIDAARARSSVGVTLLGFLGFVLRNVIFLISALGAAVMVLRRKSSTTARFVGGMAVAAVLTLAIVRVSGTLADSYNQDRALIHALVLLAPGAAFFCQTLSMRVTQRSRRWPVILSYLVGAGLVAQIGVTTSLFALPLHGGGANISSDSEDSARQYVTQGELAGARWLGRHAGQDEYVYADRYAALRVLLATGRYDNVFQEIVPQAIDRHAWVFASTVNVEDDTARSQTAGEMSTYRYPDRFLDDNYEVLYSNGLARVYYRNGR